MKTIFVLSSLLAASLISGCTTSKRTPVCHGATTHDWHAWNNLMPGSEKALHVTGKVSVNSGGWKAMLSRRTPQGINPAILLLDLNVTPPEGPATAVMQTLDVRLTEKLGGVRFTQVQVFCGQELVADLPVEDTH